MNMNQYVWRRNDIVKQSFFTGTSLKLSMQLFYSNCFAYTLNPYLTNGVSHHYHLGESSFILGASGRTFANFIPFFFFDLIPLSKQNSHRWDAAFCGVTSGAILFAYVSMSSIALINLNTFQIIVQKQISRINFLFSLTQYFLS